ncbi:PfaD family polyunsaturated fatty acid/polyketide biosynthesis protein [Streptomyces sp. NPDC056352]|uniref:PfaD family polyunsaturated fatty acid/polyketide biosynthesis protein n=1 Tax=Streptomyces sp. NPDC056352 TaxID=3345791 RepID=UPI0035DD68BE
MSGNGRRAWLFTGQGSQRKGMGAHYADLLPGHWELADRLLGFSVREACAADSAGRLRDTRHLQPVMFVLNAVAGLVRLEREPAPDFLAGHSLGELNALFAADCFDFETGVRLVRRRGELMARASGGSMVAVVGLAPEEIEVLTRADPGDAVEVSNYNSLDQTVLSCPRAAVAGLVDRVAEAGGRAVPLNVSASFHSRDMAAAEEEFREYLTGVPLDDPRIPVLSNVTARPHRPGTVAAQLSRQIRRPVRWRESMLHLAAEGVREITEIGPGRVLTGFWDSALAESIQAKPQSPPEQAPPRVPVPPPPTTPAASASAAPAASPAAGPARVLDLAPQDLGSAEFREDHGVRWSYASGSMFRAIASTALVARMARAGLLGFYGAGGVTLPELADAIGTIRADAGPDARFGVNLLHDPEDPAHEAATVDLCLRHDIRSVEAAAYLRVTEPLVRFRFSGAHRDPDGTPVAVRHIVAKVSRPEVAEAFARPAPAALVARLAADGRLTREEAEVAALLPVAGDICAEADSAGHTDGAAAMTLMPAMTRLRDEVMRRHRYPRRIRIGASGGLGTPESLAAAFVLGADFVVTGSVNQCTVEAGTSDTVKDMLAGLDVQDTAYAPAGDMFEYGSRVQVVRKGTLFAARGNKLYQLYRQLDGLEALDAGTRRSLEETCFRRPLEEVWNLVRQRYATTGRTDLAVAVERDAKRRMSAVFRWYFGYSTRVAMAGDPSERANFQVHCGPAMGAFNRFVAGSALEDWRRRHVDGVAEELMTGAAGVLERASWRPAGSPRSVR